MCMVFGLLYWKFVYFQARVYSVTLSPDGAYAAEYCVWGELDQGVAVRVSSAAPCSIHDGPRYYGLDRDFILKWLSNRDLEIRLEEMRDTNGAIVQLDPPPPPQEQIGSVRVTYGTYYLPDLVPGRRKRIDVNPKDVTISVNNSWGNCSLNLSVAASSDYPGFIITLEPTKLTSSRHYSVNVAAVGIPHDGQSWDLAASRIGDFLLTAGNFKYRYGSPSNTKELITDITGNRIVEYLEHTVATSGPITISEQFDLDRIELNYVLNIQDARVIGKFATCSKSI